MGVSCREYRQRKGNDSESYLLVMRHIFHDAGSVLVAAQKQDRPTVEYIFTDTIASQRRRYPDGADVFLPNIQLSMAVANTIHTGFFCLDLCQPCSSTDGFQYLMISVNSVPIEN
jgi:hypothetical protein